MTRARLASVLSALTASPESFVHNALKDEQIECIQRIVCHGRVVSAVLPTELGKSAIYQLTSKVLFRMGRAANATSKTTAELLVFCWLTKWKDTFTSSASEIYSLRTKQEDVF